MGSEAQASGNAGDIVYNGTFTNGIVLNNPATQNPATIAASGLVSNAGTAIYGEPGTYWTITNFGTIEASLGARNVALGIDLQDGGVVRNGATAAPIATRAPSAPASRSGLARSSIAARSTRPSPPERSRITALSASSRSRQAASRNSAGP